jgi:hypothetical protein
MNRRPFSWGVAFLVAAIFASEGSASPAPVAQSGWQPHKSNPYSGLFQPAPLVKPTEGTQATQPATSAKPKVVCGMTIIPADPSIDPKFTKVPPDRSTKFTMRLIEPPICKP